MIGSSEKYSTLLCIRLQLDLLVVGWADLLTGILDVIAKLCETEALWPYRSKAKCLQDVSDTSAKASAILRADEPPTASRPSLGLAKKWSFSNSTYKAKALHSHSLKADIPRLTVQDAASERNKECILLNQVNPL